MRTPSESSVATKVCRLVEGSGSDKLWTYSDFRPLPMTAVAATLSRLAKRGILRRVRKGVYYVPRKTRFGDTYPDHTRVAAAVLKHRGIAWKPGGPAAYNGLGLTTQVSPLVTFDVDRDIRSLRVGDDARMRLRLVPGVRTMDVRERAVLDALRDLRRIPDTTPSKAIRTISDLFVAKRVSFNRIAHHALKEPPRVRALVGAIGSDLKKHEPILAHLKKSLNPTTTFRLGISDVLPTAREWQIR